MKYLVESDKERQAEPPVDPIDAFFKSIAAIVKTFSANHQNICKSRIFATVKWKWKKFYKNLSLRIHQCSSGPPDERGINRTAFVMQILLQPGRQDLRNWIRLHRPIWLHIIYSLHLS